MSKKRGTLMISIKYKGAGGAFIPGVPARDLTQSEFESLPGETQKACIASGLYSEEKREDENGEQ